MPNGERMSFNPEAILETPREVFEARGEKPNEIVDQEALAAAEAEKIAAVEREKAEAVEHEAEDAVAEENAEAVKEEDRAAEIKEREDAGETYERAKESKGIKGFLNTPAKKALAVIMLALAIGVAGIAGSHLFGKHNNEDSNAYKNPSVSSTAEASEEDDIIGESNEAIGIKDGYGEKGMWLSENKPTALSFGSAVEVAEVCKGDEKEMIKYTANNQVESMADYISGLPSGVKPQEFEGLTMKECEVKLEAMSDEDYEATQAEFNKIMDKSTVHEKTLNGTYNNAYMRLQDVNGDVVHQNMEAVACTSYESNLRVSSFAWYDNDGNMIGDMDVKIIHDENGNIADGCLQVVDQNPDRLDDLEKVEEDEEKPVPPVPPIPPNPTPIPVPPNPTPTPDSEWGKEGDPHGGENVRPSDYVDPSSEVTEDENDGTNQGNQGYVDDGQAKPGSESENNGVGNDGFGSIIAEGANTDEERLPGGVNQGTDEVAGNNAYQQPEVLEQEQKVDESGNAAQAAAQESNVTGGDNYSDTAEEEAVRNGDF